MVSMLACGYATGVHKACSICDILSCLSVYYHIFHHTRRQPDNLFLNDKGPSALANAANDFERLGSSPAKLLTHTRGASAVRKKVPASSRIYGESRNSKSKPRNGLRDSTHLEGLSSSASPVRWDQSRACGISVSTLACSANTWNRGTEERCTNATKSGLQTKQWALKIIKESW